MKKIWLVGLLLMMCFTNYAQKCNGIRLDTMHGKWIVIPGGTISNDSKGSLKNVKLNLDGLNDLIKKNWKWIPVGGDIAYGAFKESNVARPSIVTKICNSYYARFEFKPFDCDNGKIVHSEVADYVTTYFNDLPFTFSLSFYTPGPKATEMDLDPGTDVYGTLKWLPNVKDGYFDYIQDNLDGTGENTDGYVYRYRTIVKKGKLPYLLMNKKEYYEKWKKKHSIEIENIEADKIKFSKELAGNDQLAGILKQSDQYIGIYKNYINKIDGILKTKSAEDLSKPAFEGEQEGEYFESLASSVYKEYIVKPNYDYYSQIDKYSPQVITFYLRYGTGKNEQGNKIYADSGFYHALEDMKFFDFMAEKLKPMIVQ